MLRRELYLGRPIYGKTRWADKGGARVKVKMPKAEWLVDEQPELRIVSDELWKAAHDRMAQTHRTYLHRGVGQLGGKPESGLQSRYLLSGFVRCGVCGGQSHH